MRLRVRTNSASNTMVGPQGRDLIVEVVGVGEDVRLLEGVQSVTLHCGGRGEPVTAVLVVAGVHVDVACDMPPEAAAALRLIEGVRR